MVRKNEEYSTLELPSLIRGLLNIYFQLRTIRIRRKEISRLKALAEVMKTINEEYEKASSNNENDKMKIFNISLFMLTVEYDMSSLKFMILFQTDNWNKKYLSRQLAILMYESTDDFLELLGKDYRDMINKLSNSENLNQMLNEIAKELNQFKKKNKEILYDIRNYCGAHRDKNGHKQLAMINSIESNDMLDLAADFMIPVSKMTPYFSEVMNAMSKK